MGDMRPPIEWELGRLGYALIAVSDLANLAVAGAAMLAVPLVAWRLRGCVARPFKAPFWLGLAFVYLAGMRHLLAVLVTHAEAPTAYLLVLIKDILVVFVSWGLALALLRAGRECPAPPPADRPEPGDGRGT